MPVIDSLTQHGMGRIIGGALIPRTLPGEEIDILTDDSIRIIRPSVHRVAPPCRHYKSCGGCAMQHADDAFVADWKVGIVRKALEGQRLHAPIRGIDTSAPQSRRRAKLSGRRTKQGAMVGFHARASDALVAVPECKLLTPALVALIPVLEKLTIIAASRKSEVGLTVTDSRVGVDVVVDTGRPLTDELRIGLAAFAQEHGLARLTWGDETVVTITPPMQTFGAAQVTPPPGAFLQATAQGEASLRSAVTEICGTAGKIVDLFAGCGTFTLPLAQRAEMLAVESEAEMLAALSKAWRSTPGLKRITTETRDLFRRPLLPDELDQFDAAVIDPPRAGAEAQVAELARSKIKTIAMVSCSPVTFARDGRKLVDAGFSLDWVQVVDQFRWSTHVELVSRFTMS